MSELDRNVDAESGGANRVQPERKERVTIRESAPSLSTANYYEFVEDFRLVDTPMGGVATYYPSSVQFDKIFQTVIDLFPRLFTSRQTGPNTSPILIRYFLAILQTFWIFHVEYEAHVLPAALVSLYFSIRDQLLGAVIPGPFVPWFESINYVLRGTDFDLSMSPTLPETPGFENGLYSMDLRCLFPNTALLQRLVTYERAAQVLNAGQNDHALNNWDFNPSEPVNGEAWPANATVWNNAAAQGNTPEERYFQCMSGFRLNYHLDSTKKRALKQFGVGFPPVNNDIDDTWASVMDSDLRTHWYHGNIATTDFARFWKGSKPLSKIATTGCKSALICYEDNTNYAVNARRNNRRDTVAPTIQAVYMDNGDISTHDEAKAHWAQPRAALAARSAGTEDITSGRWGSNTVDGEGFNPNNHFVRKTCDMTRLVSLLPQAIEKYHDKDGKQLS